MRNNKIAWLVTHDTYIDRRIFFFADVLQENGWSVRLFPASYTNLEDDADPEYVVRPTEWSIVKMYGMSLFELQQSERMMLERIIDVQEKHHAETGRYADSLRNFRSVEKDQQGWKLKTMGSRKGYIVLMQQGGRCLVYDSQEKRVTVIPNKETAAMAREYEYVIAKANLDNVEENGYEMFGDIAVAYIKGLQGKMIAAHCKTQDNGVWAFQDFPPVLYRGLSRPFSPLGKEDVNGKSFDWISFRKHIYDFSPILEQIKICLREEQPDMVYVADLPTLPIGIMLKRTTGCKLIVDCHEWWYKQERLWNSGMAERIAMSEKSEAELYPECDLCITVGKHLAQDMSECYQKDFRVIYSCMSSALSLQKCGIEREKNFWKSFGVPDNAHVAIFQGGLTKLRNLENLARATKYLPEDCYLAVVGDGDFEEAFLRIAKEEGNFDRLVMVGWVNQGGLLRYTVNADLGVLPYTVVDEYFSYSVPNKLMEYFEAKLPILYDSGMREISLVAGENHVGVGVDLKDPVLFGKTMSELLQDGKRLAELKANYAHCQNMFDFDAQKRAFENMLDELNVD